MKKLVPFCLFNIVVFAGFTSEAAVVSDTLRQTLVIDSLCAGETYVFDGLSLSSDTTVCRAYTASTGEDSLFCVSVTYFTASALTTTVQDPTCGGDNDGAITVMPTAGTPPYSYNWNDGSTLNTRTGLSAGTYTLNISDQLGCQLQQTFVLTEPEAIELIDLFVLGVRCVGERNGVALVTARGGSGTLTVSVTDAQGKSHPEDELDAGTYDIVIQDDRGCSHALTATVPGPRPVDVLIRGDDFVRLGVPAEYEAKVFGVDVSTQWTYNGRSIDSLVNNNFISWRPPSDGLLEVTASDKNGCEAEASLQVTLQSLDDHFFPNAFSPNDDGINDRFGPVPDPSFTGIEELAIYDRWGNLYYRVFDCPIDAIGSCFWNGRYDDGRPVELGVYTYFARVSLADGNTLVRAGDVLVTGTRGNK